MNLVIVFLNAPAARFRNVISDFLAALNDWARGYPDSSRSGRCSPAIARYSTLANSSRGLCMPISCTTRGTARGIHQFGSAGIGQALWIIDGTSFPANLRREPLLAIGIVDFNPALGSANTSGFVAERRCSSSTPQLRGRSSRSIVAPTWTSGTRGSARTLRATLACR